MRLKKLRLLPLLAFGLLGSHQAYANIIFDGEWDGFGQYFSHPSGTSQYEWQADYRPGHWHTIQEEAVGRIQAVTDATSPKGGTVARIEVRPGDTVGWSTERAEVSDMLGQDPSTGKTTHLVVQQSDGHEYYGFAVKVAPDWQAPGKNHGTGPMWGIVAQAHSPDILSSPPAIALNAENDFHINLCSGDLMVNGMRKDAVAYPFSNGNLNRGHWVQFVMDVVWSYSNSGSLAVYRRDEGQTAFTRVLNLTNTPTLQYADGHPEGTSHHYWKTGFYRSATSDHTNVIWLGPFVRGKTFNEVATAAFGKP